MSETAPSSPPAIQPATVDSIQRLKQLFPKLFVGAPKPVKLRIQLDIQERAPGQFTKQALSAFFRRYTGSTSYLLAVTRSPHRFDLDGEPAGEITDEHRKVALDELARRRANQESRQALEDQQRRNRATLLRDFHATTLTVPNFCALKGVAVEELDGLLQRAREEADQGGARPDRPDPRRQREPARGAAPPDRARPPRPPRPAR